MSKMNALEAIAFVAERKIEEAMERGEFDNLPGMGKPLCLEDLSHLPPDMRMAYTILKNSGFVEKNTEPGKMVCMHDLMKQIPDEGAAYGKMQRLKVMTHRVRKAEQASGAHPSSETAADDPLCAVGSPYLERLIAKV